MARLATETVQDMFALAAQYDEVAGEVMRDGFPGFLIANLVSRRIRYNTWNALHGWVLGVTSDQHYIDRSLGTGMN